jgi:hypothetical protein
MEPRPRGVLDLAARRRSARRDDGIGARRRRRDGARILCEEQTFGRRSATELAALP